MFLGIDVGSTSARVGLFSPDGVCQGIAVEPIELWNLKQDYYEQSTENIWQAICGCVKEVLKASNTPKSSVRGIGFDATCSLAAIDQNDEQVSLSPTYEDTHNVIAWMDHRAIEQANRINKTKHEVLKYVGGIISPEMECPKLLWVKENLPNSWKNAKFFDLVDYLTYRATGIDTRSACTVVCKWTYQAHLDDKSKSWDTSFFEQIGLSDLPQNNFGKIGQNVGVMGQPLGKGLLQKAAEELGLSPGTPVAIGIIDAHAGGIGSLGCSYNGEEATLETLEQRLALIAGTSACHMAISRKPLFIDGIWGPYYNAMIPNMWLTEGGQSSVGSLLDHIINNHIDSTSLQEEANKLKLSKFDVLYQKVLSLAEMKNLSHYSFLTRDLHILPYFHGNRSPRADPTLMGMISGLTLDAHNLPIMYLATIQALAHGTKHIIDSMNSKGYSIKTIFMAGGFRKNSLFLDQLADVTQCDVILPKEDAVLLGSAILGAVAAGEFKDTLTAMKVMNKVDKIISPTNDEKLIKFHSAKHKIFLLQYEHQMCYKEIMQNI